MLEETGAPYELTVLTRDERRAPEFVVHHPLGRVPVLELDDGGDMIESIAICLQLADLHPESDLIGPLGSALRAKAYQWSIFALAEIETPLIDLRRTSEAGEDLAAGLERFGKAITVIADTLGDRDWLIGNDFTVADVVCASVIGLGHSRGMVADRWPTVAAYVDRARARPAYERAQAAGRAPE